MNELQNHWSITIARRVLFVAALLWLGSISRIFFNALLGEEILPPPAAAFFIGNDAMRMVLVLWLATRSHVWTSWQGWLRAGFYVAAFVYGRLLFYDATRLDAGMNFFLPGLQPVKLMKLLLDTSEVLIMTWLLIPIVMACSAELSAPDQPARNARRFSISGLIGFVTIAALILGCAQFMTSDFAPQKTFQYRTTMEMLLRRFQDTSYQIPTLLAAIWVLYSLSKRWWLAFAVLPAAIVLAVSGTYWVSNSIDLFTGKSARPFAYSGINMDFFVSGRVLTVWAGFCIARLLGVQPYFGRLVEAPVEPEPEVSPIDVD
ncbi:hypothetical protein GC197_03275 [bacterium]|nr:hypothetical protein [bacterium]